jgi:hypothetical protein
MNWLASVGILIILGLVAIKLTFAPLYKRYDDADCHEAYTRARTLADTLRVDLHPYASPAGGRNPRCGEVRAQRPASPSDISAL